MTTYFCLIPARGGSKRIPNKNLQQVGGLPLIAHTVRSALNSGIFKAVYVSTDSEQIADISIEFGALVPELRASHLSDDDTPTRTVIADFIMRHPNLQDDDSVIVCMYPFAFLLTDQVLCSARKRFELLADNSRYLVSIKKYPHPIQRAFSLTHEGYLEPVNKDALEARTQDIPDNFHDAGQFYFARSKTWLNDQSVLANAYGFEIPKYAAVDVDDMDDLEELRRIYQSRI